MRNKYRHLDLFSGIGGFALGLERTGHFETIGFCESDQICRKVLQKHWPNVPIFNDVRSLNYEGTVDIITGGFPCQPFSSAGKRRSTNDDRYLWPAMFEVVKKYKPAWFIGENVAGILSMGFAGSSPKMEGKADPGVLHQIIKDLKKEAYSVRVFIIPAVAVDAPHRRDRTWIVANSNRKREQQPQRHIKESGGRVGHGGKKKWKNWAIEPPVGRVVNGLPGRMDRLKQLGNAVVPEVVTRIGHAIAATGEPPQ